MRLSRFALIGFVLATIPGAAFAQSSNKIIASSYTCAQRVPCEDNSSSNFSSAQWAQAGNDCISRGFGYSAPGGFIDDIAGLDSSKCLTVNSSATAKGMGANLVPECCVVALSPNTCGIHCNIIHN